MKNLLQQAFDPESFRKSGHDLINLLADYLEKAQSGKDLRVLPATSPQESYDYWNNYEFESNSQFFSDVLDASNHLHHPAYFGHQVSPAIPASALAGLVTVFLKNGSGVFEMAPMGTIAERWVVEELARYIGYDSASDGIMTSGGTLANLTALLTARQVMVGGDVWNEGIRQKEQLSIMVSGESHYSIDRAVRIMGLGADGLIKVPLDSNFRVDIKTLESTWAEATAQGRKVFALVGNACSTATGSHDDLQALAAFAKAKKMWFHTDAAHGGAALFSKKYRHLLDGIALADSVVIDCHKMMMTAGLATAVVYKNGDHSYRTFQMKAQYLFDDQAEREWYNMAKRTFECTKFMTALTTFLVLKNQGAELIENFIDHSYDTARDFYQLINKDPQFQTIHQPESNIICFRFFLPHKNTDELNALNQRIRDTLLRSGKYYLVQTMIEGRFYLRICLMNPLTTLELLKELVAEIKRIAGDENN